jgi:hypothetical protein
MPETWIQREILAPRRLLFNVIWYGGHLATFAYGWYSQVRLKNAISNFANPSIGRQQETCSTQRTQVFGLDISWRWTCPRSRWWPHSLAHAAQPDSCDPSQTHMAHARRRKHLVPSSGRVLDGFLGNGMDL